MNVPELTVGELVLELGADSPPTLVDVREVEELSISRFPTFVHIPLSEFGARVSELDPNADLVIVCRSGNRSAQVTDLLLRMGFKRVRNLAGGINSWAKEVDPSLPVY